MNISPIGTELLAGLPDKPVLLGSRCTACGEHFFPVQIGCANCSSDDMQTIELGDKGTLWTWTVQRFMPKSPYRGLPDNFKPYGVGYIEMPGGVKVESRLLGLGEDEWRIGMDMQLELEPFPVSENDDHTVTYAFRAVAEKSMGDQ